MQPKVCQLRVRLSDKQKAAVRAMYGGDGDDCQIAPASPADLCASLKELGRNPRPVVVLNSRPLPADAMDEGLADFIFFDNPESDRPLHLKALLIEAEDVSNGEKIVLTFPAH